MALTDTSKKCQKCGRPLVVEQQLLTGTQRSNTLMSYEFVYHVKAACPLLLQPFGFFRGDHTRVEYDETKKHLEH